MDRATDPERWLSAVRSDRVIVTQFDDGASAWPRIGRRPSSSCSMPSLVAAMLDVLDVQDGCNVLEIGTGWNAALLARRLDEDLVTTVEVDPTLAEAARAALGSAGPAPRMITGDGVAGWAPNAPYDRVIVTAAVKLGRVPYAWVRQARPAAVILAPIKTDLCAGPLVRFTVWCGSRTRSPDRGPVSSPASATATTCASTAPAGCGTKPRPHTAGGKTSANPPRETGNSPSPPTTKPPTQRSLHGVETVDSGHANLPVGGQAPGGQPLARRLTWPLRGDPPSKPG